LNIWILRFNEKWKFNLISLNLVYKYIKNEIKRHLEYEYILNIIYWEFGLDWIWYNLIYKCIYHLIEKLMYIMKLSFHKVLWHNDIWLLFIFMVGLYVQFLVFFVVYNLLGCFVDVKWLSTCNLILFDLKILIQLNLKILTSRKNEILIYWFTNAWKMQ
jgi:hypothetical protein